MVTLKKDTFVYSFVSYVGHMTVFISGKVASYLLVHSIVVSVVLDLLQEIITMQAFRVEQSSGDV